MAEEEEPLKHDILLHPNTLISWERIHLPSLPTQSPIISLPDPHETQWSTHKDHHASIVFPPTNHEGLNLHQNVPETHPVSTELKPSVTVSTEVKPVKEVAIGRPIWVNWWFVRVKLTRIVSWVWNLVLNRGGLIGSMVVVVVFYLRFWLRGRRAEAVEELLRVIKEKDERIHQLLHQIARMNELLLASHHGVPMISKATSS